MGSKIAKDYIHYFKPAPYDANFDMNFKAKMITSLEELDAILTPIENQMVAFDTETTGLTYFEDKIVGFSFSTDDMSGYYVPIRHQIKTTEIVQLQAVDEEGKLVFNKNLTPKKGKKEKVDTFTDSPYNLPDKEALDLLWNKLLKRNNILMHNAMFDAYMLKGEGYPASELKIFDTWALTFNADTDAKDDKRVGGAGLKESSKHFLGRIPPKFSDVATDKDFKSTDPSLSYYYACCDSANTFGLFKVLSKTVYKECKKVIDMDNKVVKAFIDYYMGAIIHIDQEAAQITYDYCTAERDRLKAEIFKEIYVFNINSNDELGAALAHIGLDTGKSTTRGMSVAAASLETLDHPIAEKIVKVKSLDKQLNSYLKNMLETKEGHANFKIFNTASGRFASGNGGRGAKNRNRYFMDLNFQNLTKPKPAMYEAFEDVESRYNILGWRFDQVTDEYYAEHRADETKYFVEGFDKTVNVRNCITVPNKDEFYLASIDYSGQELKVAGNFSGENNIIQPFLDGEDLHKQMAIKMFGKDLYNKERRRKAKIANFNLIYGGNYYVLMQQDKSISEDEAKDICTRFWKVMDTLKYWQKGLIEDMYPLERYDGKSPRCMYSLYGRARRLEFQLMHENPKVQTEGMRQAWNHIIQGTCGDILREVLIRLYEKVFTHPVHKEHVQFISTVHDEINFSIRKEKFIPYLRALEDMMTFKHEGWPLPIDVSLEIGYNWGSTFAWKWSDSERKKLIPKRA